MPVGEFSRLGPGSAAVAATSDAFHMSVMIVRGLGRAINGDMQKGEVGGPVRIAEISGTVLNQGIVPFILLTAVISINLGLINLQEHPCKFYMTSLFLIQTSLPSSKNHHMT